VVDAWTHYIFIGPYAEWLSTDVRHLPENEAAPEGWGELIDGGSLHWNISYATAYPPQVDRGGKSVYQYCCMPREKRDRHPRDPMLLILNADQQPPVAADWVGANPAQEVEWFSRVFAPELARLTELFGDPPALRWGLVYMRS
jgi:hypothetical protein